MSHTLERARGTIVAVQEDRFRLTTLKGITLLLTLANDADVRIANLQNWQAAEVQVEVWYSGEPNLVSGVAHSVEPLVDEWRVKIPIRLFI